MYIYIFIFLFLLFFFFFFFFFMFYIFVTFTLFAEHFHRARIYARSLYASLESYKCTYYIVKTDFIFIRILERNIVHICLHTAWPQLRRNREDSLLSAPCFFYILFISLYILTLCLFINFKFIIKKKKKNT